MGGHVKSVSRVGNFLLNYLINRCPSCGFSATTVCARCWFVLNEVSTASSPAARGLIGVANEPFVTRVLYRWDDRDIRPAGVLREILLCSKEYPSGDMMRLWGEEFFRRAMSGGILTGKRGWTLVPPPGRSGFGELDHAGALVTAIRTASGGYFESEVRMLERVGESRRSKSRSQKTKNRVERSRIGFQLTSTGRRRLSQATGYIFVDDITATGATANAAWIALGRPRAFESWSIAYKVRESADVVEAKDSLKSN